MRLGCHVAETDGERGCRIDLYRHEDRRALAAHERLGI
jgi:hypothetical protein